MRLKALDRFHMGCLVLFHRVSDYMRSMFTFDDAQLNFWRNGIHLWLQHRRERVRLHLHHVRTVPPFPCLLADPLVQRRKCPRMDRKYVPGGAVQVCLYCLAFRTWELRR